MTSSPDGAIIVEKYDKSTGKPLKGVEFKITAATGELPPDNAGLTSTNGIYTTDANGQIVLNHVKPGSYIITETKPLPGYSIDGETARTVVVQSGGIHTARFYNTPDGTLVVKKIDSVTKEPLSGVKFEIKTISGADFETKVYTTDEDGLITLTHLPTGAYAVVEKMALPGYELDDVEQTAHIEPGKTAELTFTNRPLGGLLIRKMDAATREPLGGVTIKVTHADGAVVGASNGEYVTDENGYLYIPDLKPGSYIAREVKAKEGYALDNTPKTIEIKDHQTYTLDFFNQPDGTIIVRKIDSVTKKPLEGAAFRIMTSSGELVGDYPIAGDNTNAGSSSITDVTGQVSSNGIYYTDTNGQIILHSVKPGTYVITETQTIDGYVLNSAPQTVLVGANDTQTITVGNPPKGSLIVRKIDSVTREPLQGVKIKIVTSNGDLVADNEGATSSNGVYVTDENGEIALGRLKPDTYVVTEVETIPGYNMDAQSQTVRVNTNDVQMITLTNTPKGGLVIKKMDAFTKEPLSDVIFKVTRVDGSVVGTTNGEYRTDESGYVSIIGLEPGGYIAKEARAKSGYVLDNTPREIEIKDHQTYSLEFFNQPKGSLLIRKVDTQTKLPLKGVEFKVTTSSGEAVSPNEGLTSSNGVYTTDENGEIKLNKLLPGTYQVAEIKTLDGYIMDGGTQTVVVGADDAQVLTFTNTRKGSLIVNKVDSVTRAPLAGVTFEVKGYDDNDFPIGTYTTDVNGSFRLDEVPSGVYSIKELETIPGYKLDDTVQTVRVDGGKIKQATFTNDPLGGLLIKKMDAITKEPLSDVTFQITRPDGSVVGNTNGEYRTDAKGYISIPDLAPGSYIVTETQTKTGYVLDNTPSEIEIKDHQTYTLEFFNQPHGGLVIRKINSVTKEPLSGVEFKITTADGQLVPDNNGLTSTNGLYITNEEGEIVLNRIKPGSYIVTETKTIDGYVRNAESQTVVINASDIQTLTFTNPPKGSLVVRKIDGVTKEPLQGVKFKIVASDGKLIADNEGATSTNGIYVTNENGEIALGNLQPDTYLVTETETIPGYMMDAAPRRAGNYFYEHAERRSCSEKDGRYYTRASF